MSTKLHKNGNSNKKDWNKKNVSAHAENAIHWNKLLSQVALTQSLNQEVRVKMSTNEILKKMFLYTRIANTRYSPTTCLNPWTDRRKNMSERVVIHIRFIFRSITINFQLWEVPRCRETCSGMWGDARAKELMSYSSARTKTNTKAWNNLLPGSFVRHTRFRRF